MNWKKLTEIGQLSQLDEASAQQPILIFKHSTRCSISSTALARLQREWKAELEEKITPYFLDLIAHRNVSNAIAERYSVEHESPQALLIQNGKCIFSQTHLDISAADILEQV